MSESSAAIGLASASAALPAAEQFGLALRTRTTRSRPRSAPRAASARLALRVRFWIGVSTALARMLAARKRRRRHAVDADDAHDLLDDVGLALTSGRHDGTATFTFSLWPAAKKPSFSSIAAHIVEAAA